MAEHLTTNRPGPGVVPSDLEATNSFREGFLHTGSGEVHHGPHVHNTRDIHNSQEVHHATGLSPSAAREPTTRASSNYETPTAVPSSSGTPPAESSRLPTDMNGSDTADTGNRFSTLSAEERRDDVPDMEKTFEPINSHPSSHDKETEDYPTGRPDQHQGMTNEELYQQLSRSHTSKTHDSAYSSGESGEAEQAEIQRLMSRMFGADRKANSEDEQTRHVGVVFRNLIVKGVGLGAAIQPTIADPFMGPVRAIGSLFSRKKAGPGRKPAIRTLINDFTGCIKPGEMLLVLGRPGSGCSTFLKALANQRYGFEDVKGDVTYGGTSAKSMGKDYRGEILYNPEDDLHYATLSVKNTLSFALKTRTPEKESRNEGETRGQYIKEFLKVVTKLFWIEHTLSTKVGDAHVRGVSGGEKKRVSIAEAMITKASVQCWDNSTRGLDASTALEYVQSLRSLTTMARISTSVALYQAGESLWNAFDKVILIDEGQCLFFGPTNEAVKYFESLGFERPARWTSADYLTSVSDPNERRVRDGWEDRIPRSAAQFGQLFAKSELAKRNLRDIETFEAELETQRRERQEATTKETKKKNYTLSFPKQVAACTQRQFLVMIGDKQSLFGKWGGIVFQSLIVGSIFFNMPPNSSGVFTRGGVLFLMLLFNALLALAELTAAFSSRPIMLKHKTFCFYRPAAFAIAQTVVDVPLVAIQVAIFNIIVYFMVNLGRTAAQFFINYLFIFLLTMTMYAFFRSLGAWTASLDVATPITGIALQIIITYTGYLIPPTSMHPWFAWLRYINPIAYGFEALMVNEFHDLQIQCVEPSLVPFAGPGVSPQYQSCLIQGSVAGSQIVLGDNYVETAFEYYYQHLWRDLGIVIAFFVFFACMTALGMEYQKPNAGGAAVTIFKRGQAPKHVARAIEKGGAPNDEESVISSTDQRIGEDSGSGTDVEKTGGVAKNTTVFTWQNVDYSIPTSDGERQLLNNVQGYVKPGKLTALMGASGAGKTTLLNTLAQRINFGVVTGDFMVDGKPLPTSFQRATGFAEQMDIHEPTATVREALQFSALLRQPADVPIEEKYEYCERIIDLLEMRDIAGATIGAVGIGLNQEQRKCLTIAVELASKPELLLFLDEPTSGLDSGAAFNIIRFLRKLADAGQAILCTIHQPSSVLMSYFDELILLKSGGRVVYHGSLGKDSRSLIDYFEGNGAKKCPSKANPAEYMLEAIGAGNPDYNGKDWGDVWASSKEHHHRTQEIESIISERPTASDSHQAKDDREFAMPLSAQIVAVIRRNFTSFWREPNYLIGVFMLHIVSGIFNSFTFYKPGFGTIDMQNRLFSIFMTLTIAPPLIQQLQPRFLDYRQLFTSRERNSKIYSWLAFVIGAVLVEIPYRFLAGTVYFMTWWWGSVGQDRSAFDGAYTWLMIMLFELFYLSFAQAIAAFSPSALLASLLVPVLFLFIVAFCGAIAPYAALPTFWRSWMYWLTPFHYLLEGLLGAAVHDVPVVCSDSQFAYFAAPAGQTCQSYTAAFIAQAGGYVQTQADGICAFCRYANGDEFAAGFNIFYEYHWRDFGIFCAFIAFNFAFIFFSSWLYLGAGKRLTKKISGKGAGKTTTTTKKAAGTTQPSEVGVIEKANE